MLLGAAATTALAISVKQGKGVGGEIAAARAFTGFPLYWVGEHFEQWELKTVEPGRSGSAWLIYGDCEIEDPDGIFGPEGGSCAPPLQIQISPLCSHLDVVARAPLWKRRSVRGAPVGTIDGTPVLFTRGAQVKVYRGQGSDPGLPMRALRAIRSLNTVPPVIEARGRIPGADPRVLGGSRPCRDTRGGTVLIDEERGTYRGVGIGAPPEQVWQRFGTRRFATQREPWTPGNGRLELGAPNVLHHPCRPRPGHPPRLRVLRYEDVSFLFCRGRVFALMVIAKGARTRAGLAIGDDLARARSLYPGLRCGEVSSGDWGDHYPYCVGRMRPRRSLWFGQDPIASLTISTTRFAGAR